MSRLSILARVMLGAALLGAAPAPDRDGKAGVIMLFGAHWCAPCMAEYQALPALATAAAPDRIVLAWIDRPIVRPPGAPAIVADIRSLPAEDARRLAQNLAGDGYGLPFSVMFDGAARACAIWRRALHADDLAALRAQCAATRLPG